MATGCPIEPSVNNGQATVTSNNTTSTAVYQCLSGFSLSGNQRIVCNHSDGIWPAGPVCTAIKNDINVSVHNSIAHPSLATEDWWFYLIASFLGLLVLMLLIALIWCCWCGAYCRDGAIAYRGQHHYRGCCSSCCRKAKTSGRLDIAGQSPSAPTDQRDSVFWIDWPQTKRTSVTLPGDRCRCQEQAKNAGHHCLRYHPNDSCNSSGILCHTHPDGCGHHNGKSAENGPLRSDHLKSDHQVTPVLNKINKVSLVETSSNSKDEGTPDGTPRRDSHLYRVVKPAKEPSKENKIWMPHSHSVRNINTSTK